MNKAVFLDKDGTIIHNAPYNVDPEKITLYPDIIQALQILSKRGYKLIVITNQPGIALNYFTEQELLIAIRYLEQLLEAYDIRLNGFYYCPHHPEGKISTLTTCKCRKPQPGMLQQAAKEHGIELSQSWMIGDILNDVEAGNRAGCRSILINRGNETEWIVNEERKPAFITHDFRDVSHIIQGAEWQMNKQHIEFDYE